jgi:hypothetical protein
VPLSNGQAITDFYNYGRGEINAPLPIAKSDESRLFFWSGPDGLSMVMLHDVPRDGSGGAVSFDFEGLPTADGSWVVEDDPGDFDDGPTSPDWAWTSDNTDGGVFQGGLSGRTVTIQPSFNEEATRNPLRPGQLDSWQILTGQATEPRTEALDMDEPINVTIPDDPLENESAALAGTNGTARFEYERSRGNDTLSIVYQTEQTTQAPAASVAVTGTNGTTVTETLNVGTVGTVEERVDISGLAGETVTVEITTTGLDLRMQLVQLATGASGPDSDGDGIPDRFEGRTWRMTNGPGNTFTTNASDPDTDGDGLLDGEEVSFETTSSGVTYPVVQSDPTEVDTDGDGLDDHAERTGWTIPVVNETGETEPYRFDYQNGTEPGDLPDVASHSQPGHIHVDSDPLQPNSDDDALSDYEELAYTKTDPQSDVTYGITARNQEYLEMLADDPNGNYFANRVGITDDGEALRDIELTDAQNDFDFVWDDTAVPNHVFDRLTFQMADGQRPRDTPRVDHFRSDRWLDNEDEVSLSRGTELYGVEITSGRELDPWDPDTDDDGLTDGQEVRGLTHGVATIGSHHGTISGDLVEGVDLDTSPVQADTDGDGYWDGGIGVYGVGHSDNVILYLAHLESGNGVEGDEIVQEQIETHRWNGQEHSNLHLGELFWDTDPDDIDDRPSPSLTFEVDFYDGADDALNSSDWRDAVEYNYDLYGIDVNMEHGEVLSDSDLVQTQAFTNPQGTQVTYDLYNWTEPFSEKDLYNIESEYHQTSNTQYFIISSVAHRSVPEGRDQTGIHRYRDYLYTSDEFSTVFTQPHIGYLYGTTVPGRLNLLRDERMRAVTAKTAVHEIGHVLEVGEIDDRYGNEVYSGARQDNSVETVLNKTSSPPQVVQEWSVMSGGVNDENFIPPTDSDYTAFSIEEWLSMEVDRANP